jgi:hypothetical protein
MILPLQLFIYIDAKIHTMEPRMIPIYLAGHSLEFEYREYCKKHYSQDFELIDPIDRSLDVLQKDILNVKGIASGKIPLSDEVMTYIVEEDKKDILRSKYVLAYIMKPTFGTIMEIMFAYCNNIPVFAVNPNNEWCGDIWLRYHVGGVFETLDECFTYINALEQVKECFDEIECENVSTSQTPPEN